MNENEDDIEPANIGIGGSTVVSAMFSDGSRVSYEINKETTVSDLISMIKSDKTVEKPPNRTISIIYLGRILQPTDVFSKIETLREFSVHVFYRVASAAPTAVPDTPTELRGFDRLSRMNYSQEQIAEIRNSFHAMRGTSNATQDERLDAEEEWFPVIFNQENPLDALQLPNQRNHNHNHNNNNAAATPANEIAHDMGIEFFTLENASRVQFFFGLIIGIVFGIFSLILVIVSFNEKAIMAGLLFGTIAHYVLSYLVSYFSS